MKAFLLPFEPIKPAPKFLDLVAQTESHEFFLQSLHETHTSPVAFHVQNINETSSRDRVSSNRGSYSRGSHGRGHGINRRPPHGQLCCTNGHYASACPNLHTYATQAQSLVDSRSKAFHAQCHVTNDHPDWTEDTGAIDHMASNQECFHQSTPYKGSDNKTGTR